MTRARLRPSEVTTRISTTRPAMRNMRNRTMETIVPKTRLACLCVCEHLEGAEVKAVDVELRWDRGDGSHLPRCYSNLLLIGDGPIVPADESQPTVMRHHDGHGVADDMTEPVCGAMPGTDAIGADPFAVRSLQVARPHHAWDLR